jgi:translation initiation factor IF-3
MPTPTASILSSMDRNKFWLEQVAPGDLAAGRLPVVKMVDKKQVYEKSKEQTKTRKTKSVTNDNPEVQLTWNISTHDLGHKLTPAKKALEKGGKATLIFSVKAKQRAPERGLRNEFVDSVVGQLGTGVFEWKDRRHSGPITTAWLQGKKAE